MYLDSTDHAGGGEGRIKTGTSWRALVCVGGSDDFFFFFFFGVDLEWFWGRVDGSQKETRNERAGECFGIGQGKEQKRKDHLVLFKQYKLKK